MTEPKPMTATRVYQLYIRRPRSRSRTPSPTRRSWPSFSTAADQFRPRSVRPRSPLPLARPEPVLEGENRHSCLENATRPGGWVTSKSLYDSEIALEPEKTAGYVAEGDRGPTRRLFKLDSWSTIGSRAPPRRPPLAFEGMRPYILSDLRRSIETGLTSGDCC